MINNELPKWARIGQIILGFLAILLSGIVLIFPSIATLSLVIILAVALIITGVEKVTISLIRGRRKQIDMGLGIAVIVIGITAIAFPLTATLIFITLIGFGLLFDGISRIIEGATEKARHKWNRIFNIVTGIVSVILSAIIITIPFMGEIIISLLIALALLITGVLIITSGFYGNKIMRNPI
jgi:uncharacterized membrane protein HdeD (DUF308 family)